MTTRWPCTMPRQWAWPARTDAFSARLGVPPFRLGCVAVRGAEVAPWA